MNMLPNFKPGITKYATPFFVTVIMFPGAFPHPFNPGIFNAFHWDLRDKYS